MTLLTERYANKIHGTISCFDRVVIGGSWPDIRYGDALRRLLRSQGVRLFDFPKWAEPFREAIRHNAERIAKDNGLEVEFVRQKGLRMADRVKEIVAERGDHPGLVHVFSAMEGCVSYGPWPVPYARADLGSLPAAVLLQRPQLAGQPPAEQGHRLHHGRQRLRGD